MSASATPQIDPSGSLRAERESSFATLKRNKAATTGTLILIFMVVAAVFAPFVAGGDPGAMSPLDRLKPPSAAHWFGTDMYGRDVFNRTVHGARISLIVGFVVALLSIAIGLIIGLIAGFVRILDAVVMRIMDGLMAIPDILLAIALVSLTGASLTTVIIAITVPEVPRVVRLVRGVVLTIREEAYVEAAVGLGTPLPMILIRHVLPNTIAPLIVLTTYNCAAAILIEAILSFLGVGVPPDVPSWGNVIASGRLYFQIAPWIIFFPGIFLALTILAVNVLGDGLRDSLDPRISKRM